MNATVVKQAMRVFESVFELDEDTRGNAIREACRGNESLLREVQRLFENAKGIEIDEVDEAPDESNTVFVPSRFAPGFVMNWMMPRPPRPPVGRESMAVAGCGGYLPRTLLPPP